VSIEKTEEENKEQFYNMVSDARDGLDSILPMPEDEAIIWASEHIIELERDKKRIDWLADRDNSIGNVALPTQCVENNIHSMRSAIDEAMTIHG